MIHSGLKELSYGLKSRYPRMMTIPGYLIRILRWLINAIRIVLHLPTLVTQYIKRTRFGLKVSELAQSDLLLKQETRKLLAKQFVNGEFNRLDVIVRYLAIEDYFGKNNYGIALYNKMQRERGFSNLSENDRVALIESIRVKGYDRHSRIQVGQDQRLLDGSHRLALALYFDIPEIPIEIIDRDKYVEYGRAWFERHNFTQKELDVIENKKRELFRGYGFYFSVILWPSVETYFDEIEYSLSQEYPIVSSDDYELGYRFEEIVRDLYVPDGIASWKISKKLEAMGSNSRKLRHILIEIPDPKYRKKARNNHDISTVGEAIKKKYRGMYAEKVKNYFKDIVIHTGDNYHHNAHIIKVFDEIESLKC